MSVCRTAALFCGYPTAFLVDPDEPTTAILHTAMGPLHKIKVMSSQSGNHSLHISAVCKESLDFTGYKWNFLLCRQMLHGMGN